MPYKTPGVYVEEISSFPPSVAEVATAIPAFIGYTRKRAGGEVTVAEVSTLLEYEESFGGPKPAAFTVTTEGDTLASLSREDDASRPNPTHFLHEALALYFANGGGRCYVISVGDHQSAPERAAFEAGLAELERHDEPTLIVMPEAVNLDPADSMALYQQALAQCAKLQDRFTILDVPRGEVDSFRSGLGTRALAYGAAYHPYLQSSLSYSYDPDHVSIAGVAAPGWSVDLGGITVKYGGDLSDPQVNTDKGSADSEPAFTREGATLNITNVDGKDSAAIAAAWDSWAASNAEAAAGFTVMTSSSPGDAIPLTTGTVALESDAGALATMASIEASNTALWNQIKKALAAERVVMPPSAAMAGIYAQVDRDRGVWKAPANVSVASVIGPTERITAEEQERLNVDATSGKSINAIRAFTGKGTLVWGARTLLGNDNEWRYVPVRRLFIMIEESARKSTAFAVFEPNDATTWLKVKGMLESYLYGLWERGALQGSTPDSAYFVNIGLGKTMTAQDVLEGRMNVEIGVAAVRPAEFIILRFSHKLAES